MKDRDSKLLFEAYSQNLGNSPEDAQRKRETDKRGYINDNAALEKLKLAGSLLQHLKQTPGGRTYFDLANAPLEQLQAVFPDIKLYDVAPDGKWEVIKGNL